MSSRSRFTAAAVSVFAGGIAWACCTSFGRVGTLEYALDLNVLTQRVSDGPPLGNGLHFLGGPWHRIIVYPGTLQNMAFSTADSPHDELNARTSDGLQVVLEVTYQYQLILDDLAALFHTFGPNAYELVYFDVASHLVSEVATKYSAYEFFSSKESIALAMQNTLDKYFEQHLYARVISLQIQSCRLSDEFNAAITDTVTQRQNITNAQRYLESQEVALETGLLVAHKQANATVATARGDATQLLLEAEALSTMAAQNGLAEAEAYANVKTRLGFSSDQLLRYIWWDAVGGSGAGTEGDASLLIGVSSAALITQQPHGPG